MRSIHMVPAVRLLFLSLLFALTAPSLRAQDVTEPVVNIQPGSATVTSPSLGVTVYFSDDGSLNTSTSRSIVLRQQTVTGQFTHSSVTTHPMLGLTTTSSATLTLQPGANVLSASICDNSGNCSPPTSVTYTYAPGLAEVRVSPDGGAVSAAAGAASAHVFRVVNPGSAAGTYTLRPECRDAWTGSRLSGCTLSTSSSITLAAGDSVSVTVTAPAGTAGATRLVRLVAELAAMAGTSDAGWVDVTSAGATGATGMAPLLSAVPLTAGRAIERSECVAVAVAPGAAYECGDLRIAHGLPTHRTWNRSWAPVLLYNSDHAHPRPIVYADVTLQAGSAVPTTVQLSVDVGGVVRTATFPGADFAPGVPRRVGLQWDATGWSTSLHAYEVQATAHYPGGSYASGKEEGEMAIVDRNASPFGAGWWMAGWEQIISIPGSRWLWVGGDGSTRVFEPSGTEWRAPNPDGAPDTLRTVSGVYTRVLNGGGRIEYDANGRHVRTINRVGQATSFVLNTAGRVDSITAPVPAGQGGRRWVFTYGGGYLNQVRASAPGAPDRYVTLGHGFNDGQVTSITDPDAVATSFSYTVMAGVVSGMTDRRGTTHAFGFDSRWKLSSARLWMGTSPTSDDIIRAFQAAESRGVAPEQGSGTSVAVAQAYTLLDGPRTDVTDHTLLWLTARGAPRRVRDAMGGETVLTRADARFPSLVTQVRTPAASGDSLMLRTSADYDSLGRVIRTTVYNPLGPGTTTTTRYGWNNTVNRPAWIKAPGVDTVRIGYNATTRNPIYQQQGGSLRRVYFDYDAGGQVVRIRYPHPTSGAAGGGGRDSLVYDAVGNLKSTVSPLGFVTLMYRDALGRVVETRSPVHANSSSDSASVANTGTRQTVLYDVMDRDTMSVTYGPAMTLGRESTLALVTSTQAEAVTVHKRYDAGGLPLQVRRWSTPDSAQVGILTMTYEYDPAGRKEAESNGVDGNEYYTYDAAGNLVSHFTRRMHPINMQYDALGRLTRRVVPGVLYDPQDVSCADAVAWPTCSFHFPSFPNAVGGRYFVRADTALFSYDAAGNMVRAENADAIVTRSYYPGGALATDSLRIRTWDRSQADLHVYGLAFSYDSAGRVHSLEHPRNLTGGVAQYDQFRYDHATSALDTVISRVGLRFSYQQDLLGRVVADSFPGGNNVYRYDLEGRRIAREGAYVDSLAYDARGKVLTATLTLNGVSTSFNHYSGLGNLVATEWRGPNGAQEVDEYRQDALGHTVWTRSVRDNSGNHPEYRYAYSPGESRVNRIYNVIPASYVDTLQFTRDTTYRAYDEAGNVEMGSKRSWRSDQRKLQTRPYFGADGRLRAEQGYEEMNGTANLLHERRGYFTEHRYDALGRRVLVRTRRDGLCYKATSTIADCTGGITRYVWSGDNILWEMRGPGADSVSGGRLNETSAPGQEFGIVGYTHAGGVDRPLVVWKGSEVVVPHTNWRGVFGKGTNPGGGLTTVAIEWPGFKTTAWHAKAPSQQATTNWMGSLIGGMRDPGGTMYMRNRFYDPQTGQFTQTDPIGIGGGLNTYGFAAGDPVGNWDPFGTCAWGIGPDAAFGRCSGMEPQDDGDCLSPNCRVSQRGVAFIARHEQFVPNRYLDPAGIPTIGYGHRIFPGEEFDGPLTVEEGLSLLWQDITQRVQPGLNAVRVRLTQNQVDALGSFIFNVGSGAFQRSTLLRRLNAGDYAAVPSEMQRWTIAGGRVQRGLVRRRREEAEIWTNGH